MTTSDELISEEETSGGTSDDPISNKPSPDCASDKDCGHGTCDDGQCNCEGGGDNCANTEQQTAGRPAGCADVTDCGHGTCVDAHCICEDGWGGKSCTHQLGCADVADCDHGTCVDAHCICEDGWGGERCTHQLDCASDDECGHGRCDNGQCKCKDGWDGDACTEERCGDIDGGCGKHGNCRRDKCECHYGWKGGNCDEKITYQVKFIATSLDSRSRSAEECRYELNDFMEMLKDNDKEDLLDLAKVTAIELPSECGDYDFDTTRTMMWEVIDHDRSNFNDGGKDKDHNNDEPILILLVFDESSEKTVDRYTCVENMEEAADEIGDNMKPNDLKRLDGSIVYMDYEACGSEEDIEWVMHEEDD